MVVLYTRPGCHLCEEVQDWLSRSGVPWRPVDITADPELFEKQRHRVPVVEVDGREVLAAPITRTDVRRVFGDKLETVNNMSGSQLAADRITVWLARHWLALVNVMLGLYIGLPVLAPVLEKTGHPFPAQVIYTVYRALCHELPQRSFFLFGERPMYSLQQLVDRVGQQNLPLYPWPSGFIGNEQLGYKIALCQRDMAIYGSLLLCGLMFALLRSRIKPLSFWLFLLIGVIPIGLDGGSQFVSYLLPALFPGGAPRESTWVLRVITGTLFGVTGAWVMLPQLQLAFAAGVEGARARLGLD